MDLYCYSTLLLNYTVTCTHVHMYTVCIQEAARKSLPLIVPVRPTLRRMMGGTGNDRIANSTDDAEDGNPPGTESSHTIASHNFTDCMCACVNKPVCVW